MTHPAGDGWSAARVGATPTDAPDPRGGAGRPCRAGGGCCAGQPRSGSAPARPRYAPHPRARPTRDSSTGANDAGQVL